MSAMQELIDRCRNDARYLAMATLAMQAEAAAVELAAKDAALELARKFGGPESGWTSDMPDDFHLECNGVTLGLTLGDMRALRKALAALDAEDVGRVKQ